MNDSLKTVSSEKSRTTRSGVTIDIAHRMVMAEYDVTIRNLTNREDAQALANYAKKLQSDRDRKNTVLPGQQSLL